MAAATSDQGRSDWALPAVAPNECHTVLQNTIIYRSAVAMLVAGKARPLVAATSGSTLLGVAAQQYAAPAGSDLVLADGAQAVFKRGVFRFPGKAGDLPTEALVGQPVFFGDDSTVQATAPGAPNLSGTLRAVTEGAFWVEV